MAERQQPTARGRPCERSDPDGAERARSVGGCRRRGPAANPARHISELVGVVGSPGRRDRRDLIGEQVIVGPVAGDDAQLRA